MVPIVHSCLVSVNGQYFKDYHFWHFFHSCVLSIFVSVKTEGAMLPLRSLKTKLVDPRPLNPHPPPPQKKAKDFIGGGEEACRALEDGV